MPPEPVIGGPAARIMSLRDGTKKMSKSDPSDYSRINMTDDADAVALKLRKAKTDPKPLPGLETLDAKRANRRQRPMRNGRKLSICCRSMRGSPTSR